MEAIGETLEELSKRGMETCLSFGVRHPDTCKELLQAIAFPTTLDGEKARKILSEALKFDYENLSEDPSFKELYPTFEAFINSIIEELNKHKPTIRDLLITIRAVQSHRKKREQAQARARSRVRARVGLPPQKPEEVKKEIPTQAKVSEARKEVKQELITLNEVEQFIINFFKDTLMKKRREIEAWVERRASRLPHEAINEIIISLSPNTFIEAHMSNIKAKAPFIHAIVNSERDKERAMSRLKTEAEVFLRELFYPYVDKLISQAKHKYLVVEPKEYIADKVFKAFEFTTKLPSTVAVHKVYIDELKNWGFAEVRPPKIKVTIYEAYKLIRDVFGRAGIVHEEPIIADKLTKFSGYTIIYFDVLEYCVIEERNGVLYFRGCNAPVIVYKMEQESITKPAVTYLFMYPTAVTYT